MLNNIKYVDQTSGLELKRIVRKSTINDIRSPSVNSETNSTNATVTFRDSMILYRYSIKCNQFRDKQYYGGKSVCL